MTKNCIPEFWIIFCSLALSISTTKINGQVPPDSRDQLFIPVDDPIRSVVQVYGIMEHIFISYNEKRTITQ